ncbi:hypothetical protein [Lentibacillus sediminis]|uniref:hypothetical protein n=1 Tax=Lentibacillus sediminis TaxID=1940529 RepID=UPI00130432FE|nr:hypothetical protein [Lentibacillus sediminis]
MERENEKANGSSKDSGLIKFRSMEEINEEQRNKRKQQYEQLIKRIEEILKGES